jgi:hypothetical protein
MTRAQHIESLCRRYNIKHHAVMLDNNASYFCFETTKDNKWIDKHIFTPPIVSKVAYLCALHEIGHIAKHAYCPIWWFEKKATRKLFDVEYAAWGYAIKQCREPVDYPFIRNCLRLYLAWADKQEYPRKDHPVWQLINVC